jgi:hypothetical protein
VSGQQHSRVAFCSRGKSPPVPTGEEAGWTPEPVWTMGKSKICDPPDSNLEPLSRPARRVSLHRLDYRGLLFKHRRMSDFYLLPQIQICHCLHMSLFFKLQVTRRGIYIYHVRSVQGSCFGITDFCGVTKYNLAILGMLLEVVESKLGQMGECWIGNICAIWFHEYFRINKQDWCKAACLPACGAHLQSYRMKGHDFIANSSMGCSRLSQKHGSA